MKKNNKGFLLAEVITVSVVTIVALVIIYSQFVAVDNSYYKSFKYNNVDKLFLANQLKQFINGDNASELYSDIENISYADITNCDAYFIERTYCRNLINAIDAKQVLVTKLDTSSISDKLKQNKIVSSDMYTFISNNKSLENGYRLIIEFNDNTYATLKLGSSVIYKDSILNGADPELKDNLVPVVINNDGTVKKADLSKEWYNYTNKTWANAVTLKDKTINYETNEVIPESNIDGYFVWIPRYKYEIFNEGNYTTATTVDSKLSESAEQEIQIVFESKSVKASTGSTVGSYLTHPAFTTLDVNGIWVGKFETSGSTSDIDVLPNQTSLRGINVKTMFELAYNYDRNLDSHMMKNTEWGAVAYLSHSKYGINEEIRINNSATYTTGCAATVSALNYVGKSQSDHTEGYYNGCENAYNTTIGYLASTTGNISGIYDMSGGAWEYMASYVDGLYGSSGFDITSINTYDGRYFDVYSGDSETTTYNKRILGDATGELGAFYFYRESNGNNYYHSTWGTDDALFIGNSDIWFRRGGNCSLGAIAGSFSFNGYPGAAYSYVSFRLVLAD